MAAAAAAAATATGRDLLRSRIRNLSEAKANASSVAAPRRESLRPLSEALFERPAEEETAETEETVDDMKTEVVHGSGASAPTRLGARHNSISSSTRSSSPATPPEDYSCSSSGGSSQLKLAVPGSSGGYADSSANTSKSVSPIPPLYLNIQQQQSNGAQINQNNQKRTPIPSDSPLLSNPPTPTHLQDPAFQKVRSFNRDMRRAKSFRALHKSGSTNSLGRRSKGHESSASNLVGCVTNDNEVSFNIKRSVYGRKGWKVMPAPPAAGSGENLNLKTLEAEVVDRVMARIREIELSGHDVPEVMTVKI